MSLVKKKEKKKMDFRVLFFLDPKFVDLREAANYVHTCRWRVIGTLVLWVLIRMEVSNIFIEN